MGKPVTSEMMKVSSNYIKEHFDVELSLWYSSATALLSGVRPFGCNEGKNGWNYDAYRLLIGTTKVCITTGYGKMKGQTVPRGLLKEYETKARQTHDAAVRIDLLLEFVRKVLGVNESEVG